MFRILSRHLKQRTVGSILDYVHSLAQGGEKDVIFSLLMNKENWARPSGFG